MTVPPAAAKSRSRVDPRFLLLLLCLVSTFYSIYTTLNLTTTTATGDCNDEQQQQAAGRQIMMMSATTTSSSSTKGNIYIGRHQQGETARGVFIMKVERVEQAVKALCSLTHFFKDYDKYDIRIFVDYPDTMNVTGLMQDEYYGGGRGGGTLIQVIHDEKWMKLPGRLLSPSDTEEISNIFCRNLTTPSIASCSTLNVKLNTLYSYLWSYYYIGEEPSLQEYEYFVMLDAEAYLTQPILDPFKLLQDHDLVGFFDIEAYQLGDISKGVQETAERVFTLEERRNRYLDTPNTQFFDNQGVWNSLGNETSKKPSVWTHFYGGRLDFFRTPRYKDFARRMIPYLYKYRVDKQAVIGAAWALLADNDRVWYLPKRGIHLGIYHRGWVDNRETIRKVASGSDFEFHTLNGWKDYKENYGMLLTWEEYVNQIGYGGDWHMCRSGPGKAPKSTAPYTRKVRPGIGEEMLTQASDKIKRLLSRNATSFVISLDQADKFLQQNKHSINSTTVIPAVQGWSQETLDVWADLRGQAPKTISHYDRTKDKSLYDSPHAVGCYLSHWNLWRTLFLWQEDPLPEFYFIFEDDTVCAADMYRVASDTVRKLPPDWDMLYIGGKSFTFFRQGPLRTFNDSTALTLRRDICQGAFGVGEGPLAPDGSRNLSESQPYWKADYITNTDAYVINPRRLEHLVHLLKPEVDAPIDIRLGDMMVAKKISAYMTTRKLCEQGVGQFDAPVSWPNMYSVFVLGTEDFDTNAHPALGEAINGRYLWGLPTALGSNCLY
jgi:GR25 family glycosyltransferase involved in LPS biosynthesis